MRLSDRTHAGRVGEQPLTARAVPTLAHMLCAAPVFAPHGGDPQLSPVLGHLKTLGRLLNGGSPSYGAGAVGGTLARSYFDLDFRGVFIFRSTKLGILQSCILEAVRAHFIFSPSWVPP